MDRLEKLQKICNARFQKLFESANAKEFEQRKAKWLRSEALVDLERGHTESYVIREQHIQETDFTQAKACVKQVG